MDTAAIAVTITIVPQKMNGSTVIRLTLSPEASIPFHGRMQ